VTESPLLRVRLATRADAAAIAEIHNQGIEDRIATFETAPTLERLDDIGRDPTG
jgi:L-amino acid N-acyltransferase YncA